MSSLNEYFIKDDFFPHLSSLSDLIDNHDELQGTSTRALLSMWERAWLCIIDNEYIAKAIATKETS
jgi:hypothetical protein